MNLYREAGELLLGSRLKRTGDRFLSEISQVYRLSGIDFDPSWFPVFYLLDREKTVTISRFSEELSISQSGATQLIKGLEKKGLLEEFQAEGRDKRTKNVRFTEEGAGLLENVRPVWKALDAAMGKILQEGPSSRVLLPALTELEEGFDRQPLSERVIDQLSRQRLIKNLRLTPAGPDTEHVLKELLLERFAENPAPSPGELQTENAVLLTAPGESAGYAVTATASGASGSDIREIFLSERWRETGAEEFFLNLIDEQGVRPVRLHLFRHQNRFISAARSNNFRLSSWTEESIILTRREL